MAICLSIGEALVQQPDVQLVVALGPAPRGIKRDPKLDRCNSENWTVTSRSSRNWIRLIATFQLARPSLLAQAIAVAADGDDVTVV